MLSDIINWGPPWLKYHIQAWWVDSATKPRDLSKSTQFSTLDRRIVYSTRTAWYHDNSELLWQCWGGLWSVQLHFTTVSANLRKQDQALKIYWQRLSQVCPRAGKAIEQQLSSVHLGQPFHFFHLNSQTQILLLIYLNHILHCT